LTAEDYEDDIAKDPRIDALRDKMHCVEDPQITLDYHDPSKRTIGNGLTVTLNDGTKLDEVFIDIPVGHKFRREEVIHPPTISSNVTGETIVTSQIRPSHRSSFPTKATGRNYESQ
jgi:2-methylcitrate dehydratase PrpD